MWKDNVDYMEERARVLGAIETLADGAGADHAERVRELVRLGEEIVALLEPMEGDEAMASLRGWLETDLAAQRALLAHLTGGDAHLAA